MAIKASLPVCLFLASIDLDLYHNRLFNSQPFSSTPGYFLSIMVQLPDIKYPPMGFQGIAAAQRPRE
ncbi:MAG: hypothetical protein WCK00_14225, partial [Deltaproteobacteria bacterium]